MEILHRAKDKDGNWIEGLLFFSHGLGEYKITRSNGWQPSHANPDEGESTTYTDVDYNTIQSYANFKDKNGKRVFFGQEVLLRIPIRNQQTHTGDNIPLGSYTEPLEPKITEIKGLVKLIDFMVCIVDEEDEILYHLYPDFIKFDLESTKDGFLGGWGSYEKHSNHLHLFVWNDNDEGDLQYLLQEYDLKSEEELVKYLGLQKIE